MSQSSRHIGKTHIFTNRASSTDPNVYIKPGANEVLNIDLNGGSLLNNAMDDTVVEFLTITGTGNALIVSNGMTAGSATITNVSSTNISSTTLNVGTATIGSLVNSTLIGNTITAVNSTITNLQVSTINGASYPPAQADYISLASFGSGADGDLTLSASTSNYLTESKNYRNVTIPYSSILYLVNARLKCSGTLANDGLIWSSASVPTMGHYNPYYMQKTTTALSVSLTGTSSVCDFTELSPNPTSLRYPFWTNYTASLQNPTSAPTSLYALVSTAGGQGGYYSTTHTSPALATSTARPKKGIYEHYLTDGHTMTAGNFGSAGGAGIYASVGSGKQWPNPTGKLSLNDTVALSTGICLSGDGYRLGQSVNDTSFFMYVRSGAGYYYTVDNALTFQGRTGAATAGASIKLSDDGKTGVASGRTDNSNVGAIWAYRYNEGTQVYDQTKITCPSNYTGGATKVFGGSLALSKDGNVIAAGAQGDSTNVGAIWLFVRSGAGWVQGSKVSGTGYSGSPFLGSEYDSLSLSYNGGVLIAGAMYDGSEKGGAWIFVRSGNYPSTLYTQLGTKLTGAGQSGTRFGWNCCMNNDGNCAVVCQQSNATGNADFFVFIRSSTGNFYQPGNKVVASGGTVYTNSLAMSGDGTIVAMQQYDTVKPSCMMFYRNKTSDMGYTRFQGTSYQLLGSGYSGTTIVDKIALSSDATTLAFLMKDDRHVGFNGTGSTLVFNTQMPSTDGGFGGYPGGVCCVQANTITGSGLISSNGGPGGSISSHMTESCAVIGQPGGGGSGGYTIVEFVNAGHTMISFGGSAGSLNITSPTTGATIATSGSNGEILISNRTSNTFTYITSGSYTV